MDYHRRMQAKFPAAAALLRRVPWRVGTDCSGIETPLVALELLGAPFEHRFSSEKDPLAAALILARRPPPAAFFEDVCARSDAETRRAGPVDLYFAGPPCQPFSQASAQHRRTWDDARARPLDACVAAVRTLKPAFFVVENVPQLAREGEPYEALVRALSRDHHVHEFLLTTSDFGVPQRRRRLYLVGLRRGLVSAELARAYPEALAELRLSGPPVHRFVARASSPADDRRGLADVASQLFPSQRPGLRRCASATPEDGVLDLQNHYGSPRCRISQGTAPTILTEAALYAPGVGRVLTPRDLLSLQGVPPRLAPWHAHVTTRQGRRLAGNGMSANVLCALLLAFAELLR
jgi:site-specific DNA-cytosine methylase